MKEPSGALGALLRRRHSRHMRLLHAPLTCQPPRRVQMFHARNTLLRLMTRTSRLWGTAVLVVQMAQILIGGLSYVDQVPWVG